MVTTISAEQLQVIASSTCRLPRLLVMVIPLIAISQIRRQIAENK